MFSKSVAAEDAVRNRKNCWLEEVLPVVGVACFRTWAEDDGPCQLVAVRRQIEREALPSPVAGPDPFSG